MIGNAARRIGPEPRSPVAAGLLTAWSVVAAGWLLFKPWPYLLVVLLVALTPWMAVWLIRRDPDLSLMSPHPGQGQQGLFLVWSLPAFALVVASVRHHFMDYGALLAIGAALGALLFAALVVAETDGRTVCATLFAAAFAGAWGWGVVALTDVWRARDNFTVSKGVVQRAEWHRRGGHQLTISAMVDGRPAVFDGLSVTEPFYALHPVGAPVCVEIHKGLAGARHVYASACPPL